MGHHLRRSKRSWILAWLLFGLGLVATAPLREALQEQLTARSTLYRALSPKVWFFDGPQVGATFIPSLLTGPIQSSTTTIIGGSTSHTSTLSPSVSTTTSYIVNDGCLNTSTSDVDESFVFCRVELTNATTVTVTRNNNAGAMTAAWHVVSVLPFFVKSVQIGTISLGTGDTSKAATLSTAVTVNRALLIPAGCTGNIDNTAPVSTYAATLAVTGTTAVTATRGGDGLSTYALVCGFTVVDLR